MQVNVCSQLISPPWLDAALSLWLGARRWPSLFQRNQRGGAVSPGNYSTWCWTALV